MTRRASLTAFALLLLLIVAAGAYTWWWFRLADGVRDGIERWAEDHRAQGWQVSFGDLETSGFPGPLRVRVERPHLTRPDGLDWQTARLQAKISPLDPFRIIVDGSGRHEIASPAVAVQVQAQQALAEVMLDNDGRLDRLDITGTGVTANQVAGDGIEAASVRLMLDLVPEANRTDELATSVAVDAVVEGLVLPASAKPVLGPRLAVARLTGRIQGSLPAKPAAEALTQWRENGGTAELDRVTVEWGPLQLAGKGTLALDRELQPLLALSTSIRGFDETVDQLKAGGLIRSKDARTAKLVLALMAKPQPNGAPPAIEVPLTIQDGELYLGPVRLAKVSPISWPTPDGRR